MINLHDCVEIGKFTRPHGYKGALILSLNNLSFDDIEKMERVFVLIDGLPVPFFISEFTERSTNSLLINLEDIRSSDQAKDLASLPVFIESSVLKELDSSKPKLSRIIGYEVVDVSSGSIGVLDSIINNPQNPLFRVISGTNEILIPLQDEFIVEIIDSKKEIILDCPTGLLDI